MQKLEQCGKVFINLTIYNFKTITKHTIHRVKWKVTVILHYD